jgi:hypothetical protein
MAFNYDTDDIEEKEMELFDSDNISNDYSQFCCYDEEFDDWFDFIHKILPQSKLKWVKFGEDFNNSIDDLPDDIEYIYFDDATSFNQKINKFPKNLKKIKIRGFSPVINQLPYTLKYLELHDYEHYYDEIINFPPNLISLTTYINENYENYNYLPITLKSLYIDSFYLDYINDNTIYISLTNLPPNLKYLYIAGSKTISINCNNLPDSIKQLILYQVFTNIYKLPSNLKELELDIRNPYSKEIKERFPNVKIELTD